MKCDRVNTMTIKNFYYMIQVSNIKNIIFCDNDTGKMWVCSKSDYIEFIEKYGFEDYSIVNVSLYSISGVTCLIRMNKGEEYDC